MAPASAPLTGDQNNLQPVIAPLPGSIFSIKCKVGDSVQEGDVLLILEAMKMETEINSPISGTVNSILVQEGANIQTGDKLILIE